MNSLSFTMPLRIETARLILRLPKPEDVEAWVAFLHSERGRFVGAGPDSVERQTIRGFGHLAGLWILRGCGAYVFEDRASGKPIGHGGIWYPLDWPEAEFGWCIWEAAFEGKGYAREALQAQARLAFAALGVESFVSYIARQNHASQNLAKRLGAVIDPDAAQPGFDDIPHDVWRHHKESFRYD